MPHVETHKCPVKDYDPSRWKEDAILIIPLQEDIDVMKANTLNAPCRCCAAINCGLLWSGQVSLSVEILQMAPSPAWKQMIYKAAILGRLRSEGN